MSTVQTDVSSKSNGKRSFMPFSPAADVLESAEQYLFVLDLPGVSKEELVVQILDGKLSISTEPDASHPEPKIRQRRFELPADVDAEAISAELENGVLTVSLTKRPSARPRKIAINGS